MKKQTFCFIRMFTMIAVISISITSCTPPSAVMKSGIKDGEKNITESAGFKELKEIRVEKISDTEEKVTFVLNGYYPPKISMSEEDPPKIVCEFPETRLSESIKPTIEVNGI